MINFQQILRRIEGSDKFKDFKKDNENAYLCSAFFVVDFESQSETKQLDYYIPEKEKIASFLVDVNIKFNIDDIFQKNNMPLKEISKNFNIDFSNAVEIAKENIESINIKEKEVDEKKGNIRINKVIAILQKLNEEQIWNLTCMVGGTSMILMHINADKGEVTKIEKADLMSFMTRAK